MRARYVQIQSPKTHRYLKLDRLHGKIVSHKSTYGLYSKIKIIKRIEEV